MLLLANAKGKMKKESYGERLHYSLLHLHNSDSGKRYAVHINHHEQGHCSFIISWFVVNVNSNELRFSTRLQVAPDLSVRSLCQIGVNYMKGTQSTLERIGATANDHPLAMPGERS
jgi:hypothetical protein